MYLKCLFFIISFSSIAQNENLKTLPWQEETSLRWADFEGTPSKTSTAAASTASGISCGFSINKKNGDTVGFKTTITSLFYPEKSWVKPVHANAHILAHEQLHFDITELFTRKLRKRVDELQVSPNLKSQLKQLYQDINTAWSAMQKRYDLETNHSINKEKQAEWQALIAKELQKLEAYTSK